MAELFLVRFVFHDQARDKNMKGIYVRFHETPGATAGVIQNASIHTTRHEAEKLAYHANTGYRGSILDNMFFLSMEGVAEKVTLEEGTFKVVEYILNLGGRSKQSQRAPL